MRALGNLDGISRNNTETGKEKDDDICEGHCTKIQRTGTRDVEETGVIGELPSALLSLSYARESELLATWYDHNDTDLGRSKAMTVRFGVFRVEESSTHWA